ncbi:2-C-methyl-D-erythritol 2,4-cyclodiphosphate synthase [Rubritalea profundi]|jgi:2-C-methyl-D-erythritol 2,4-cyclodiphosphate synthase|uniref:2-C-methyl-D-erythritol 2,4-cyclodiphosphate synthase n=1 Tax=Rubritalea profundi TaxID=1658618 RepID=A0A2S7U3L1_9BACT|nr:2-C-methyl-D-erythritol 2,4-cyclodiphosphate synthase [Rubritalea profundi]PQJ29160.1 2-C-methyl-D-erythritol 2,4-cyclodiphosphate synthase [Rubritalea profundi]
MKIRTGIGYDVHQFAEGRKCILGGVDIPHSVGLLGHSDADVLCHAIADAVLGALGLPDIGFYFPPEDASIEGICSLDILKKCRALADEKGAELQNVDSAIVAEAPKVMPHLTAMKKNISAALGIEPEDIGIKATTNETMGFVGRKEGIAAMATCCLIIPNK